MRYLARSRAQPMQPHQLLQPGISVLFAVMAAASAPTAPSVQRPAIRLGDPDRICSADLSWIRFADPVAISGLLHDARGAR